MQTAHNYNRIANAIQFILDNFKEQPTLEEIASHVHMSPFHFQKLFTEWAGVSPKKFLQYITLNHAKSILRKSGNTLDDTAFEAGLSGSSRLHDLFVNIERMTPGEYKNGGESLHINFSFTETMFGKLLIASTPKGICYSAFVEEEEDAMNEFKSQFPRAQMQYKLDDFQKQVIDYFKLNLSFKKKIQLHLKGTDFQIKVWETLLKVPPGNLMSYGQLATSINKPSASRAVGTAVGDNPIAYLIPCHRVIQSSGLFGQYHWGADRKTAMIGWEAVHNINTNE